MKRNYALVSSLVFLSSVSLSANAAEPVHVSSSINEGLIRIENNQINRDSIWDTLCFKTAASLLAAHFNGPNSKYLDFSQVYSTRDLGTKFGLIGFVKVETGGDDAAPHHIHSYSTSAVCEKSGKEYVLSDLNQNAKIDFGDLNLIYIDFDRY